MKRESPAGLAKLNRHGRIRKFGVERATGNHERCLGMSTATIL
jgi:hypothetical protein